MFSGTASEVAENYAPSRHPSSAAPACRRGILSRTPFDDDDDHHHHCGAAAGSGPGLITVMWDLVGSWPGSQVPRSWDPG